MQGTLSVQEVIMGQWKPFLKELPFHRMLMYAAARHIFTLMFAGRRNYCSGVVPTSWGSREQVPNDNIQSWDFDGEAYNVDRFC